MRDTKHLQPFLAESTRDSLMEGGSSSQPPRETEQTAELDNKVCRPPQQGGLGGVSRGAHPCRHMRTHIIENSRRPQCVQAESACAGRGCVCRERVCAGRGFLWACVLKGITWFATPV